MNQLRVASCELRTARLHRRRPHHLHVTVPPGPPAAGASAPCWPCCTWCCSRRWPSASTPRSARRVDLRQRKPRLPGHARRRKRHELPALPPGPRQPPLRHLAADYWQCVSDYVQSNLTDTLNVGSAGVSITDQQIAIPAGSGYIELDGGNTRFRATITKVNDYGVLRVKVVGRYKEEIARPSRSNTSRWKTPAPSSTTAWPPRAHLHRRRRRIGRHRPQQGQRPVHQHHRSDPRRYPRQGGLRRHLISNPMAASHYDAGARSAAPTTPRSISSITFTRAWPPRSSPPSIPPSSPRTPPTTTTATRRAPTWSTSSSPPTPTGQSAKFTGNTTIQGVL